MSRYVSRTAGGLLVAVVAATITVAAMGTPAAAQDEPEGQGCRRLGIPYQFKCAGPFPSRQLCESDKAKHWSDDVTPCLLGRWRDADRWYYGFRAGFRR